MLYAMGPAQFSQPVIEPKGAARTLLFTRSMGKRFRMSFGSFLQDDVLISVFIDRLFAVSAKYDFRHLTISLRPVSCPSPFDLKSS
jgi:hypothetical protein